MMSDLEKTGQNVPDDSAIVIVETGPSVPDSRNKLFRPTGLPEESSDTTRLRSKAPAVSSLSDDVKIANFPTTNDPVEAMVKTDSHHRSPLVEKHSAGSSGKHKQRASKKSSSNRRASITPADSIPLNDMDSDPVRTEKSVIPALLIPADVKSITSGTLDAPIKAAEKCTDDLNDEVAELRTPRAADKIIDWSDDGEAGGLPRTESRASRTSRVSRAVRQLFCCGVAYSPPSEDDISCHRVSGI